MAPDGSPHVGIPVAVSAPGREEARDTTGQDGRFEMAATAPGALVVRVQTRPEWLPLMVDGSDRTVDLRLTLRAGGDAFDGFVAASSDAEVAAVMNAYAEAEAWHRTDYDTPELAAAIAERDARMMATPLNRQDAVRDSMSGVVGAARHRALAPRAAAFDAGARPGDGLLVRAARALWRLDKVRADSAAAVAVLRDVPPLSPVWSYEGLSSSGVNNVLVEVVQQTAAAGRPLPAETEAYLRAVAYDHPDQPVRAQASGVLAGAARVDRGERPRGR